jgi:MFS family permease
VSSPAKSTPFEAPAADFQIPKARAFKFILLFGFISLLADMTYEGGRSITGPYLAVMGASATAVGVVSGIGEFIGYSLRLVSGYLTDRTGRYWFFTILGYTVNLLAVPMLAFAGRWELAAGLIMIERVGKALRQPARDAMLSHATKAVGSGTGFGIHEAMDQIGAVLGPLVVAWVLSLNGSYREGFAVLFIPAALTLIVLAIGRALYPKPRELEVKRISLESAGFPKAYWVYVAGVACIAAGYADFPLIAYHFEKSSLVKPNFIPILYAIAMGVDALAALAFGRLFDRIGVGSLVAASIISCLFAPLVFLGGSAMAFLGVGLWGVGMGAQESIMRAAVAEMVPAERRGSAYGIFNTGFGVFWFLGSALMGVLYDISLHALVIFSVAAQLLAVPMLLMVRTGTERASKT